MRYGIFPKGTIYQSGSPKNGVFFLRANLKTYLIYRFLTTLGAGLIAFFILTLLITFYPIVKEEMLFKLNQKEIKIRQSGFGHLLKTVEAENISRTQEETKAYGLDSNFSLIVPKIGAKANILANIDAGKENEYLQALGKGVAHAKGTYFPGQNKTVFLFAHSADSAWNINTYNAVFFLLHELVPGDSIIVYFTNHKYFYEVTGKLIVDPEDTSWFKQGDEEELILQTCYPPGTTWQRLLIIAKKI